VVREHLFGVFEPGLSVEDDPFRMEIGLGDPPRSLCEMRNCLLSSCSLFVLGTSSMIAFG